MTAGWPGQCRRATRGSRAAADHKPATPPAGKWAAHAILTAGVSGWQAALVKWESHRGVERRARRDDGSLPPHIAYSQLLTYNKGDEKRDGLVYG